MSKKGGDKRRGQLIDEYIKANDARQYDRAHQIFLKIKELDNNSDGLKVA